MPTHGSTSSITSALLRSFPLPRPRALTAFDVDKLRVRPFFLLAAGLTVTVLAVLALADVPELPVIDKVLHFLGNGATSLLIYPIVDPPPISALPPGRIGWSIANSPLLATLLISVLVMGVLSEFVQGLTPYRIFDWSDVVANLAGLVLTIPWSVWFWRNRNGQGLFGQEAWEGDVWDARGDDEGVGLLGRGSVDERR